jgi:2-methylfumaryl-CoA isomerase
VLRPWFEQRDFATVSELLDQAHVLWSPYRDMAQATDLARGAAPLVAEIDQAGIGTMLATGSPVRWDGVQLGPVSAPTLGADTFAVLADSLGLTQAELGRLHGSGVVGGPR